jgi:hypothetical protein
MIITEQKSIKELKEMIKNCKNVAIIGCGGCASFYGTGGRKEVKDLSKLLDKVITSDVIPRACSIRMVKEKVRVVKDADCVISLTCGVGTQTMAETMLGKTIIPGLDTKFIGREGYKYCIACGNCILHATGGICPIARCPKSHMNGPCGGVRNSMCETKKMPCIWILIYNKLKSTGKLNNMKKINPPKNFRI